jgi:hypothetical protein
MNLPIPKSYRNSKPGTEVKIEMRRARILDWRMQGLSHRRIAAKEGCSDFTVRKDLKHCMENLVKHNAAKTTELRELINRRYEMVVEKLWKPVSAGNLWAIDRLLTCLHQITVLNGIAKPVPKILAGDPDNPIDINHHHEIEDQLLARMRKLAGLDSPPSDEVIDVTPGALPAPPVKPSE